LLSQAAADNSSKFQTQTPRVTHRDIAQMRIAVTPSHILTALKAQLQQMQRQLISLNNAARVTRLRAVR
jgi:restriction endonuclease S subunit